MKATMSSPKVNRIVTIINKLFTKHLFVTNTVTCSALLGLGDGIVQLIEKRRSRNVTSVDATGCQTNEVTVSNDKEINSSVVKNNGELTESRDGNGFDWYRNGRMCAIGMLLGPMNHIFYKFLDKYLVGRGMKIIAKKIAIDQIVAAPFFTTAFIFSSCYFERKTTQVAAQEWKDKFPIIYMGDWLFWPPVQFVNFYFFPAHFRVLYIANVTLIWNVFISYVKHHDVSISSQTDSSNITCSSNESDTTTSTPVFKNTNLPLT